MNKSAIFSGSSVNMQTEKPEGRPSINTLEGWNLHRRDMARFALLEALQREPTEEEVPVVFTRRHEDGEFCGVFPQKQ